MNVIQMKSRTGRAYVIPMNRVDYLSFDGDEGRTAMTVHLISGLNITGKATDECTVDEAADRLFEMLR